MTTNEKGLEEFYEASTPAGVKPIDYVEEGVYDDVPRLTTLHTEDLPRHIKTELEGSLIRGQGALAKSLDHHIGTLSGLELADKKTISSLKRLRAELDGTYENDKAVLGKVVEVLGKLRPAKR
jgi:hypothetical protein